MNTKFWTIGPDGLAVLPSYSFDGHDLGKFVVPNYLNLHAQKLHRYGLLLPNGEPHHKTLLTEKDVVEAMRAAHDYGVGDRLSAQADVRRTLAMLQAAEAMALEMLAPQEVPETPLSEMMAAMFGVGARAA